MAQPHDWLYFLTDEQGRSYRVNNGIVEAVSTPTPLPITPDGWQEKTIKYGRDSRYFGLFRTFTTPLKYVKQAALIVRKRLYSKGTEDKLYQVIHRLDKSFGGGWIHKFFYKGELDLTQSQDEDTNISVNIMEGDLSKLLKANENTTYELDVDVPEAVIVKMDGVDFKYSTNFLTTEGIYDNIVVGGETMFRDYFVTFFNYSTEGQLLNVITQDIVKEFDSSVDYTTDDRWFLKALSPVALNAHFKFSGTLTKQPGSFTIRFRIVIIDQDGNIALTLFDETKTGADPVNEPINIDVENVFNMVEENRLFLKLIIESNTTVFARYGTINLDESATAFSYKSKYRTTFIKGLRPAYVAQKLLDKITGGGYTFTSAYLSSVWENLLVTSGDAIRGFAGAKLKISWSDYYEGYNVPCNLSSGIRNQQLYAEEKATAFLPTIQQALGTVRGMKPSAAKDFQYNVVKIGYPNTDTEDVNGRDEFNVTHVYTSPITRVNKVLELVSKIIASMFEIELTRINLEGKTTTDDSNDNKNFFLHVEKTETLGTEAEPHSYYKLLRNTYDSVTGLTSPSTAFNLELHPELCLRRHGNFMRSVFYWQEAGYLVRETSDKNANVVVIKAGQTYIGNKNISIGSLDAPLFIPVAFKVEGPMPADIVDTMDAGPDGTFSFVYNDELYYGFPMEVGIQPANRPAQETTLLCSPQTNLNQLITISR